ncbi:uncharacterized protein LOC112349884 [Selaginella moellendorffii]|uniref:uncharacterized protein LOC112349884 n=1 Tax=Selaginella moellendorffii TaxID=88036 RepID=UPI000D1CB62C|nr:uncharacterized protein LOC112349884 [Selaginella moellendorffii]|eukprot:XP_024540834.1 uncharacterized protein LOC112349884 [Selaginella moellendorffii]
MWMDCYVGAANLEKGSLGQREERDSRGGSLRFSSGRPGDCCSSACRTSGFARAPTRKCTDADLNVGSVNQRSAMEKEWSPTVDFFLGFFVMLHRLWRLVDPFAVRQQRLLRSFASSAIAAPRIVNASRGGLVWSRPARLPPVLAGIQCRFGATKSCKKRPQKKDKMKSYSSLKHRFKLMPDGTYARAHAGKRHNASSKTKKQRRQLRGAALVHPGYAKIIRKLGFTGTSS